MRTGTDPKEPGAVEPRIRAARDPSSQTPIRQGWTIPPSFDEYRVVSRLSQGGMGEVYLGHDTLLDRPVAIKFMNVIDADVWMREQFLTEARAAARLQHNNVVGVYRVGELDGRPYIVSEYVRGQSLDTLPPPLPWQRALELGIGLARGLAAAHRGGVLHRDIKPSNAIISSSGEVKLLDFGLAEFSDGPAASAGSQHEATDPAALKVSGTAETLDLSISTDELQRLRHAAGAERPSPVSINPAAGSSETVAQSLAATQPRGPVPDPRAWPSMPTFEPARSTRIAGTPHYMAPEIWLGEPSTRQSDIYGMGALLFELCTGRPPHHEARGSLLELCQAVNSRDVPPLSELVPEIDPRFAEVVARCLRRRPEERYASGEELREALSQLLPREQPIVAPEGNPYRGLLAFEAEHRALFFGRSNEIGTLIERLRTETFILVAADSGVGKSSLCRAGVLPLVAEGALKDGRKWVVLSMVPGQSPLLSFCSLLAPLLHTTEAQLVERLRAEPTALGRELSVLLKERSGLLLFIDQLEEIVTLADPEEARILGEVLDRLAQRLPGLRLLMTARSDFLSRIAAVPGLGEDLARALYFLRPMHREKIRQAIVGPAQARGVRFESEQLVDLLVEETDKADGGLPLLQFALAELWDVRTGDAITLRSLEAIGGVAGALARHADQVVLSLPADQSLAARRILMRLVSIEGTRARRTEDELGADAASRQAIEALVRGRLIVPHATSEGILYEVAHEALLKGWGTLRQWLELFAEHRAARQRIEDAAAEWVRLGRAREALWGGRQLADLDQVDPASLTPTEREFLAASRRAQRRGRLLRNGAILSVPLVLSVLYGAVQYRHLRERGLKVEGHLKRGVVLLSAARKQDAELRELRRTAFAAFDSQAKEEGEKLWARALKQTAELEEVYGRTSQAIEAALAVDPGRDDVRALLADSLSEAALAAERARHLDRRNDLVQRMALYDLRGERQRRWQEPAQLSVATTPEGAVVRLQRYIEDERQRRGLAEERGIGRTPIKNLSLKEGSYLLSIELPGRAEVRYPVFLSRGESLQIRVGLPVRKAVPEGFVYIPPGRSLFGTSGDESVRQSFLSTVPLHEVSTGAYLIQRSEVSYADWIEFLSALPPAERLQHGIRVPKGGIGGGVELRDLGNGRWQLALQPVTRAYVARSGEGLIYAARKLRKEQDWLRLPVSGIGLSDVRAYAAWLDRSGRVPGARLCTEQEWERAARGADDRELPHGNTLEPGDANFDETYGKDPASAGPDEAGSHPASQSPFGLSDMAGNVFEWAESSLAPNEVVARGGSYFMAAIASRSTNRTPLAPDFRDPAIGARICATVPPG